MGCPKVAFVSSECYNEDHKCKTWEEVENLREQIPTRTVTVKNVTKNYEFQVRLDLTDNEVEVILAGGQLRFLKKQLKGEPA